MARIPDSRGRTSRRALKLALPNALFIPRDSWKRQIALYVRIPPRSIVQSRNPPKLCTSSSSSSSRTGGERTRPIHRERESTEARASDLILRVCTERAGDSTVVNITLEILHSETHENGLMNGIGNGRKTFRFIVLYYKSRYRVILQSDAKRCYINIIASPQSGRSRTSLRRKYIYIYIESHPSSEDEILSFRVITEIAPREQYATLWLLQTTRASPTVADQDPINVVCMCNGRRLPWLPARSQRAHSPAREFGSRANFPSRICRNCTSGGSARRRDSSRYESATRRTRGSLRLDAALRRWVSPSLRDIRFNWQIYVYTRAGHPARCITPGARISATRWTRSFSCSSVMSMSRDSSLLCAAI